MPAQLKSAVILAGLNSFGKTLITEYEKSRYTENMLMSSKVVKIENRHKRIIHVLGKKI